MTKNKATSRPTTALTGQSKTTVAKFTTLANKIAAHTLKITAGETASDEARIDRALVVAEARDLARARKVSFQSWCDEQPADAGWNYNSIKAWIKIGIAARSDRAAALAALTEKRQADRQRQMEFRGRLPAAPGSKQTATTDPLASLKREERAADAVRSDRERLMASLSDSARADLARDLASENDQVVVDKSTMTELDRLRKEVAELRSKAAADQPKSPQDLMSAFARMGDNAQREFIALFESQNHPLDIPVFLGGKPTKKRKGAAKKAAA
tara:strand:- start:564 stop:1376 length:813 start_codon:yes stop_codon:yes gene_type:complete